MAMTWYSKNAPIYVWMHDLWHRETDKKVFTSKENGWIAEDGEIIPYTPKSKMMDGRYKEKLPQKEKSKNCAMCGGYIPIGRRRFCSEHCYTKERNESKTRGDWTKALRNVPVY